ncbi:copper chaperone PCu(A)C [Achromobacter sp. F4_2707]|uniref:copper chaperone PCu(A)C n=1 Tax=Achromobacter sp. F4_2707 TaxID=3114286 RepID=UPI0039C63D21
MMRKSITAVAFGAATLFAATAHAHSGHGAHDHHAHHHHGGGHEARTFPSPDAAPAPEGVSVNQCWIRALPNRLPAAAYFQIQNTGTKDVVLVGAQAEGFGKVMLHTHAESNGMATMVHVDEVVVPAGGGFEFAPRGHHVMLEQADFDLEIGSRRPITLWFEGEGLSAFTAQCDVRPPGTLQ